MKAISETASLIDLSLAESAPPRANDLVEITKIRLNVMVLITTTIGFVVASPRPVDLWQLMLTLIGTGLCACGASVLNQAWEHPFDRKMGRTFDRPVAAGRISATEAAIFGIVLSVCGLATLGVTVNLLACSLALATILLYVLIYTPLKRVTTLNTLIGAIPGAIPPIIGCAAASGRLDWESAALFAILFCWQMPHFLAIAILLRDDYALGGFKMMPVVDKTLTRTSAWIVMFGLLLIIASLMPVYVRPTGLFYTVSAIVLGVGFLATGVRCAAVQTRAAARVTFFASLIYLPLVLAALMIDRLS